ncbi:NIPSNAP family protein [Rhodovastum atsumiense]|uniref:NIPSNAP family protein n=1 Tax=Rhodovastum atsumiense TaxID=504468 RepID=A0A5M6IM61_9PROT|nr:NIPSNAP family protein [Rhodovastum atsumiense]KAA5609341.1 NIPSNAP family protein [Rhodovastum atsumiense]CAH2602357.1 NIPSNAP family protein [Rhodovastum atsumiense]
MIYELRTYQIQVGKVGEYVAHFQNVGLPIISRYAELVGYWTADPGPLNHVFHLWRYASLDQRAERRARLYQDAEWQSRFLPVALPLIVRQESAILNPTAFSPLA